ncbi:MAG: PKD domain-containing protein [Patescibacteria group bacterium]|nr:PKD domain-containing protein [Patescibacteria group bacterium]
MSKKPIYLLLIIILGLSLIGWLSYLELSQEMKESVQAATTDNVSGWAWSENIGWISFNNTTGGGTVNYGVNIDSKTGEFSGYAWSENIGWIDFAPAGPYPSDPQSLVKLDFGTNKVSGWARALSHGDDWDGWIKLSKGPNDSGPDYGVSRRLPCEGKGGVASFEGYAWGSDVIGWIKFKGTAQDGSDYKVQTALCQDLPPLAKDLDVAVKKDEYCTRPAHHFSWKYVDPDGDDQIKFQFQVTDDSTWSDSAKIDRTVNVDYRNGTTNNQAVIVSTLLSENTLSYNTTYYWRVKVWDKDGMESDWVYGPSFKTENHPYPYVRFEWHPTSPKQGESVKFEDQTVIYGGATTKSRLWEFPGGNPATSTEKKPTVTYHEVGDQKITLTVTDSSNYTCSTTQSLSVSIFETYEEPVSESE